MTERPTAGPGPLKSHLFASQDPIQIHHPKSARVGCAEWRIHYSLHSRLLASARVNTSPVPCPHLTLIAQVSRVARNVYSRPDTHSVTSILARARSSGILCPGYFYKASLFSDKRARVIFPATKQAQLAQVLWLVGPIEISSDIWMQTAITVSAQAHCCLQIVFCP